MAGNRVSAACIAIVINGPKYRLGKQPPEHVIVDSTGLKAIWNNP